MEVGQKINFKEKLKVGIADRSEWRSTPIAME